MILDEINSNLVEQVGKVVDKDGKFYVGEFPKCWEPLAVCDGLSAAVSTASFSSILAPAYIFNNGFFQLLVLENGEIKLGDEYDDVLYLWENKQKKTNIVKSGEVYFPEGITLKYPYQKHPEDSNVHFEKILKSAKNCIVQTSEGFWKVNGHTYSTYEYAKQALKNSGIE